MSTETITIRGVDPKLLDQQRLAFAEYLTQHGPSIPTELYEHLNGILNMLDAWSDERRVDLPEKNSQWLPKTGPYPSGAITVIGWVDNNQYIQYAINGYCQVYRVNVDAFLERYRPVTAEELANAIPPSIAYFSLDAGPMILGFTYGDRWNGWGRPFVEKESFRKWLEASGDAFDPEYSYMKFDGDNLIYHDPMAAEDDQPVDQVIPLGQLEYEGRTYEVYNVANGWCWNQYDLASIEAVDFSMDDDPFHQIFVPEGLEEHHLAFRARQLLTWEDEE
jgi:hypothetical protein